MDDEKGLVLFPDSLVNTESTDDLNHFSYAQVISKVIQEVTSDDSLNIGVFGPWGIGKSSIMSMVQALLPDEYCCVNINAWRLGGDPDALRRAVILESRRMIGTAAKDPQEDDLYTIRHQDEDGVNSVLRTISSWLLKHWWKVLLILLVVPLGLTLIGHLLPDGTRDAWFLVISSLTAAFPVALFGSVVEHLYSIVSRTRVARIRQPISSVEQFSDVFDKIVAEAASRNKRLVYFLDDVDRLAAEQLVETLRTVKAFFDRPGCTFVIACHDHLLTEALASQLEKDERDRVFANTRMAQKVREYIDKIFQLRVYVNPTSESDTVGYARKLINNANLQLDDLDDVLVALIHSDITTPRQVKRQLNDFLIALRSARLRAHGAVKDMNDQRMAEAASRVLADTAMLAKLVTIRATWPVVYDRLFDSPDLLARLTSAALAGTIQNVLEQTGLKGRLSSREEVRLQGYLARTRHIHNSDLVSFLYLRPSDAAIRLGTDERTREILKAAENGDVQRVRVLLRDVDSGKYDAWVDYLLDQIGQVDQALRKNLLVSTSVVLAIVDDSVLEKRADRLASNFLSLLSEDVMRESMSDGVIRALAHAGELSSNVVVSWLEQNLLPDETSIGQVESGYFLAFLRNWSKLVRIQNNELNRQVEGHLHVVATENFDTWSSFVSFCVAELGENDSPEVRSKLVELTLEAGDPGSEDWMQYEGLVLQIWPPEESDRVDWEALLRKFEAESDNEAGLDSLSSLGWTYAKSLRKKGISEEVERRAVALLLREDPLQEVLRENNADIVVSLADVFAAHAPKRLGQILVGMAAEEFDLGTVIVSVVGRIVHSTKEALISPVVRALVDEVDSTLVTLRSSRNRLAETEAGILYQLVDAISAYAPDLVSSLIVADLNRVANSVKSAENLSDRDKLHLYGSIATPLLSRLSDLLNRFPENTLPSVSGLSYYGSSSEHQAFLAVKIRREAKLDRKLGNHDTIIRSIRYGREGAVYGILEMLDHRNWSQEQWGGMLAALVGACATHEGLLDELDRHHGRNVLAELRDVFGTNRAVVGRLVMAKPDMLSTIDGIAKGLKGFTKGALEGLCNELERSSQRDAVRTLEEVAAYLRPLRSSSNKEVRSRIFRAWHNLLSVSRHPDTFAAFTNFYESRQMLDGNLGRLDDLIREVLQEIRSSSMPAPRELIDAIEEMVETFGRSSLKAAVSRARDTVASVG